MSIFDEAAEVIEDEFGSAIRFIPNGGAAKSITAMSIWQTGGNIADGQEHQEVRSILNVMVRKSTSSALNNLTVGDCVQYQGFLWDFMNSMTDDGAVITAQFVNADVTQYGKRPSQL